MANALVVVSENTKNILAPVMGNSMNAEAFESLNSIIDNIGQHSGDVTDATRQAGNEYINKFEELVIRRINDKVHKMSRVKDIFNMSGFSFNYAITDMKKSAENELFVNILDKFAPDNVATMDEIMQQIEELEEWIGDNEPEEPDYDPELTVPAVAAQMIAEYRVATVKYNMERRKKLNEIIVAYKRMIRDTKKTAEFKRFIKELDAQIKNTSDMRAVAEEKAALARMNMVIPDADIRAALQALSDFQKSL